MALRDRPHHAVGLAGDREVARHHGRLAPVGAGQLEGGLGAGLRPLVEREDRALLRELLGARRAHVLADVGDQDDLAGEPHTAPVSYRGRRGPRQSARPALAPRRTSDSGASGPTFDVQGRSTRRPKSEPARLTHALAFESASAGRATPLSEDGGHAGEVLDVRQRIGVEHEEVGILADLDRAHLPVQAEEARGVPRHRSASDSIGESPASAGEVDVVLQVAELGVERTRVAPERHAVHQPQVAQRADHRQEVVEVALEVGELRLLARR